MHARSRLAASVVLILGIVPIAAEAASQDWPQFRGPRHSGTSLGNGVLDRDPVGLAVDWKRTLGSGYSSIAVAEGHAVTMFTDGHHDYLAAFDPATGDERWRYRIAETYKGHTGSDDGPISTPVIDGGTVYGLGPRGQLFALRLADGEELWQRTLGETDSRPPYYGFATVPVVAGDVVVVETGGPDGYSICAFDRASGELRWSVEDDPVAYQSPALLELAGRTQLVAINDKVLVGIAPASGEVLWKHEHGTSSLEGIAQPMSLGPNRLLVNSLREVVALEVTPQAGAYAVAEVWRTNALQGAYSVPVLHEGHLYGFSRRFLTCVDAATGEVVWKSRPPGGHNLILVDGRLVLVGAKGELVVAEASPAGYREKTRLPLFETTTLTAPSFAGGVVFVRDLKEMARVRITDTPAVVAATTEERELLGEFGAFVRRVEAADDKAALIDELLKAQESFPIIEGENLVHFVYQGEVEDIALAGNFLPFNEELVLDRIAGTDVYFKSLPLEPDVNWEYRFNVDFGQPISDPLNPHPITSLFLGPSSELRMPQWQTPRHIAEPEGERGRIDSFQFKSEVGGNERRIRLYLPPGYASSGDARYPLAVVVHGQSALEDAQMDRTLDNLIGAGRVAPLIAAFVPPAAPMELVGPEAGKFVKMLAEELVPHLDKHYRTLTDPASRALLGVLDGGTVSVYAAFTTSRVFGKVAAQSMILMPPLKDELLSLVASAEKLPLEIYVEWSRHDIKVGDVDVVAASRELVAALEEKGYEVRRNEVAGAWGWGSWRAQFDDILEGFYPVREEEE